MKQKHNGVRRIHQDNMRENNQSRTSILFAIALLIYIVLSIYQLQIRNQLVKQILLHFQVILTVSFVISEIKHSYLISILVTLFCFLLSFLSFFTDENEQAIHAMIIYGTTIVIISLIHKYRVKLTGNLEHAIRHNKKSDELIKELRKKNKQLSKLNKDMREKEKQLNQLAFYDILTKVANRKMLINQMDFLISISKNFSVVFIDLDNFKKINDTMGHQAGDSLLKAVTLRIGDYIHPKDMFGRLGGDEFVLIVQRELGNEEILSYVEGLRQQLIRPFRIKKAELTITASFGISAFPKDGRTSSELLKFSDIAMYQVKSMGKNDVEFFTMSMKRKKIKKL
ncbi:GGDEF domain-containing protein [Lachnoclostridium phytofermentans]|uniref:Diguanylate cyclase n=1 Tax=Lachnoclostridium phytofermentans (strain ATCC 700394 / DSM 18823 / ISDg) TaxID=357809 RepID=A9KR92_LACP7|nr:GGDEF domain-containing protein [Lachnoclostridium phytofermentans]ABX40560.1 diguanylate cyclase [Lachnoclostridium phytofermentans ISDg]